MSNQNTIPSYPASQVPLSPSRGIHDNLHPVPAIHNIEAYARNGQHRAYNDAPCTPPVLQAFVQAYEASSNGAGDISFTLLHRLLRGQGLQVSRSDHFWMFNDILSSAGTMSKPLLWTLYLHSSECRCMGLSFERNIGVADTYMFAIAHTSALAAWKRGEEAQGTLDMYELDELARSIRHQYLSTSPSEELFIHQGIPRSAPRHETPIPNFIVEVSELYRLTAHAYLASVLSRMPRAYWVLFRVNDLVNEFLAHIGRFGGVMSVEERKLLKFPLFVAATMVTRERAGCVNECLVALDVEPCCEAVAEIQRCALYLRRLRRDFRRREGVVSPPIWRDVIFMNMDLAPDDMPPVTGFLWI